MWKYSWNFALAPHYLCVKINVGHLPHLQNSEMQPANQLDQVFFFSTHFPNPQKCNSNGHFPPTPTPTPKKNKWNELSANIPPKLRKVVSLRADLPEGRPKLAHDLSEHDAIDTTMGPNRLLKVHLRVSKKQDSNGIQWYSYEFATFFCCGVIIFFYFSWFCSLDVQRWDETGIKTGCLDSPHLRHISLR